MAQAFVTQAQNMLVVQWTEPQRLVLKEWTYPDWFTPAPHKGKACVMPKKSEHPLATSSGHSADGPTNLAATSAAKRQLPMFTELSPPHDDGWQPRHMEDVQLDMPKLRDEPEVWQCGLTSTQTNVHVALWSCPTAMYHCMAYVGCSWSNSATHVPKLLSSNEHSMCFLPLNSSRHPASIGMRSGGSA